MKALISFVGSRKGAEFEDALVEPVPEALIHLDR